MWQDDSIEILLDPNPDTKLYYHLIVNPIGTIFSQKVKTDYPPNHRFAPTVTKPVSDRKRKSEAKIRQKFKSLIRTGIGKMVFQISNAAQVKIETQITSRYWSIEIALMRDFLEPELTGNWRLNLHPQSPMKNANSVIGCRPMTCRDAVVAPLQRSNGEASIRRGRRRIGVVWN